MLVPSKARIRLDNCLVALALYLAPSLRQSHSHLLVEKPLARISRVNYAEMAGDRQYLRSELCMTRLKKRRLDSVQQFVEVGAVTLRYLGGLFTFVQFVLFRL